MTDTRLPITVMYGDQTFKGSSGKLSAFAMKGNDSAKRDFLSAALKSTSKPTRTAAAKDGYEGHGAWFTQSFTPEEGKVLCLQASLTVNGRPYADGALFLALRDDAPLLSVQLGLRPDRNATYTELPVFSGRADILAPEELGEYGIVLFPNYVRAYMEEDEIDELFTTSRLDNGAPKPKTILIEDDTGASRRVRVAQDRPRRVRIRR